MEPNKEDYINYRIKRANETLVEVASLIELKYWNTAINRMYYACYYAVGALLVKHAIKTSSHSGCIQKFGQLFVITGKVEKEMGKHYSELFEKRHKGDYDDFFYFDEETVLRLYKLTPKFIKQIEKLLEE